MNTSRKALEKLTHGRRVGAREGAGRSVQSIPPPLLSGLPFLYITKILIFYYNETITLFLKQLQSNFKYQRVSSIFQCHKWK